MNKVIDKGFRSCRFVSTIVKHPVCLNDNIQSRFSVHEAGWTCVSFFSCLFVCWIVDFGLLKWVDQAKQCHLMLSRPCKACLCGNSVSKHNLEWTCGSGSVSHKKMCLCEDC